MQLQAAASLLNRELGLSLKCDGYRLIREWVDWWKGYHRPFHAYREHLENGAVRERKIYSMNMAKKVCEDWASILLNERAILTLGDQPSSIFLQGEDGSGGLLGSCGFFQKANRLIEQSFCTGTGAFLLRLERMRLSPEGNILPDPGTVIGIQTLPAYGILPLSVRDGEIQEAAFCSSRTEKGKNILYLETHLLGETGYEIENRRFEQRDSGLLPLPLPLGIARKVKTGSFLPLFAVVRPNIVGTSDLPDGLGESIFAGAIDNLKGVDLAFHNFCRDFQLGGKKVFYNRSLLERDGSGAFLAPDDVCQQLFVAVGDRMPDEAQLIYEHNPALRVQDNILGVQAQLDYLSMKCGLGAKHYHFDPGRVVTATQYAGDRQLLLQNASKHYQVIRQALRSVVRMILWAGRAAAGAQTDPDTTVSISFDDSLIIDKESERARDRADAQAGLMSAEEYRKKWNIAAVP